MLPPRGCPKLGLQEVPWILINPVRPGPARFIPVKKCQTERYGARTTRTNGDAWTVSLDGSALREAL